VVSLQFGSFGVREELTEEEMLGDGKFRENFGLVHFEHAGIDLVPRLDARDIV
jgi:hypothetical protein